MTETTAAPAETDAMWSFARSIGVAEDAIREFVEVWRRNSNGTPKEELRWRLNQRLQGADPGEPVNWRGERGLLHA